MPRSNMGRRGSGRVVRRNRIVVGRRQRPSRQAARRSARRGCRHPRNVEQQSTSQCGSGRGALLRRPCHSTYKPRRTLNRAVRRTPNLARRLLTPAGFRADRTQRRLLDSAAAQAARMRRRAVRPQLARIEFYRGQHRSSSSSRTRRRRSLLPRTSSAASSLWRATRLGRQRCGLSARSASIGSEV